jgi:hypothetical protein
MNFIKIQSEGAELFHADRHMEGQTDIMKLTAAFCDISNVLNKLK